MGEKRILVLYHDGNEEYDCNYTWVDSMDEVKAFIADNACYPYFHVYGAYLVNPNENLLQPGDEPTCSPGA